MMKAKSGNSKERVIGFLFLFMFVFAVTSSVVGVLVPNIKEDYNLSYDQIGYLSSVQNIGGFVAALLGGILADRFDKLKLTGGCVLFYTLSLLLVGKMPPYILLLLYFFIIGAMVNALSMLVSAYISETCQEKAVSYLNMSHGFYGVGSLMGPAYATVLFSLKLQWTSLYWSLGMICALLLIAYLMFQRKAVNSRVVYKEKKKEAHYIDILKNPQIILLCVACCIYMGQQTALNTWITSYSLEKMTDNMTLANSVTILYWLGVTSGRFLQSLYAKKIDSIFSTILGCVMGAVLLVVGLCVGNIWLLLITVGLSGMCSGAAFPNLIGAGGRVAPAMTGAVTSVICLSGSVGGIIFPWLMARIISNSYVLGLLLAPFSMLITALLLRVFLWNERRN